MFRFFRKRQGPKQAVSFRRKRKSTLFSRSREERHIHECPLLFETLEPRWVLDSALVNLASSDPTAVIVSQQTQSSDLGSTAKQMENLDRGIVVMRKTTSQAYISWRLLGTDPSDISFNLYRSANGGAAVKLNSSPITLTTDYTDTTANFTVSNSYYVRPVTGGVEQAPSESWTLAANAPVQQYLSIPLNIPPGGTDLNGNAYTYSANDCSVGDLDGDGQYEIVVKWDPSDSKDNSQSGYTGDVYIDAYKLNGTQLWRIDLGKNIRAGAHYTQMIVYDLDGDGKAEIALKTAPGTIDGMGNYVLMPGDNPNADYRNSSGYVLSGPEYLTIFDGATGRQLGHNQLFAGQGQCLRLGR